MNMPEVRIVVSIGSSQNWTRQFLSLGILTVCRQTVEVPLRTNHAFIPAKANVRVIGVRIARPLIDARSIFFSFENFLTSAFF